MRLERGANSDVGRTRSGNEDSFLIDDSLALFVVADGMGGHRAGEVASATAVSALRASMAPNQDIVAAVRAANSAVYSKAGLDPELLGMGTTMTAVVLSGHDAHIGHVGDSRCYLLRAGMLTRLTQDHSFVEQLVRDGQITAEQAAVHPKRSILTRALGIDDHVEIDHYLVTVQAGDRLMLCSDGLTGMVREEQIAEIMGRGLPPQDTADLLVATANEHGGEDNITSVVVDIVEDGDAELPAVYLTEPPLEEPPLARVVAVPLTGYDDVPTIETDAQQAAQAVRDAMAVVEEMEKDHGAEATPGTAGAVAATAAAGTEPAATDPVGTVGTEPGAEGPFQVPDPRADAAFEPAGPSGTAPVGAPEVGAVAVAAPGAAPAVGTWPPSEPPPKRRWLMPAVLAGVAVVVVVIVALVLVGGDDDDGTSSTTTAAPSSTTASTRPSTTTASTATTTTTRPSSSSTTTASTGATTTAPAATASSTPQTLAPSKAATAPPHVVDADGGTTTG